MAISAAAPATLALAPAGQSHAVGAQACVQATATDRYGNPTSAVAVRFSVGGVDHTGGSPVTNLNGQATFCYTGQLGGTDTVGAFADTNGNGTQEGGEPGGTAGVSWTLPASTAPCSVFLTGSNGDRASLGGLAIVPGAGGLGNAGVPFGAVSYDDTGPARAARLQPDGVQAVVCDGAHAGGHLRTARIDGGSIGCWPEVRVVSPGVYAGSLLLSTGYSSGARALHVGVAVIWWRPRPAPGGAARTCCPSRCPALVVSQACYRSVTPDPRARSATGAGASRSLGGPASTAARSGAGQRGRVAAPCRCSARAEPRLPPGGCCRAAQAPWSCTE